MQVEVITLDDTVKIVLKLFPFPDVGLRLQGPLVDLQSGRIVTRSFPFAGFGLVEFCLGEFPSVSLAQDRMGTEKQAQEKDCDEESLFKHCETLTHPFSW